MLSDPAKRKKYDTPGARWQESGDSQPPDGQGYPGGAGEHGQEFHFGGTGFSDFFEQYFSGGSRYGFPRDFAEAGDLYLRVRHAAHPDFTTRESDVYHDLEVTPWEAVLGAEIIVPTLEGSMMKPYACSAALSTCATFAE